MQERIFCILPADADHITVKLEREDQLNLIEGHPDIVRPARLYSHHGWTYVDPAACDEALIPSNRDYDWLGPGGEGTRRFSGARLI